MKSTNRSLNFILFSFLAPILTAALCFTGNLFAYSGGDGIGTPYQIANVTDFQQLSATPTDWNKSFILTANINLTGLTFTQAPIAQDTSSSGNFQGTQFTGVLDGNGHTISNLTINASTQDYIGLFGYIGSGGQIRNLGVVDANMQGHYYSGGLAGYNNYGKLTACYATGSASGSSYVGGLVGYNNYETLTSCYATGSVSGGSDVGGLVGFNNYGTLTNCYATDATSSISAGSYVGGLVGYNSYGTLTNCYATGSVSGGGAGVGNYVGGLVGSNYGTLSDCHATGSVSAGFRVGGLVGFNDAATLTGCYATGSVNGGTVNGSIGGLVGDNMYGFLTNCYATGSVSGLNKVGGLVGVNARTTNGYVYGRLTNCYSTGSVIGTGTGTEIGGMVGFNNGAIITASFWDVNTSGQTTSAGGEGKTIVEMKTLSTFTSVGWDFTSLWKMLRPGEDYPRLAWQQVFDGDIAGLYGVDMFDLKELATHWLQTGCPAGCEDADIDGSGTVDFNDYALLAKHWLEGI